MRDDKLKETLKLHSEKEQIELLTQILSDDGRQEDEKMEDLEDDQD